MAYATTITGTAGLLLYWRLAETATTTAADASGNANTGTYVTGYAQGAAPAVNDPADLSVWLDGRIKANVAINSLPTGSMEIWFKVDVLPAAANNMICGFNDGDSLTTADKILILTNTGALQYYWFDPGPSLTRFTSVPVSPVLTGAWNHAVGTIDGTAGRCYLNGREVGNVTGGTSYVGYTDGRFSVGYNTTTATPFAQLAAYRDEAAIYSSVLTPAQVSTHYAEGVQALRNPMPRRTLSPAMNLRR